MRCLERSYSLEPLLLPALMLGLGIVFDRMLCNRGRCAKFDEDRQPIDSVVAACRVGCLAADVENGVYLEEARM